MDIRKHYLLFGVFAVVYVLGTGLLTTTDDRRISMTLGGLLIVSGYGGFLQGKYC